MRIQLQDSLGTYYYLTSADPAIIGAWFAEHVPNLMSANAHYNHPLIIDVWPDSEAEYKLHHNARDGHYIGKNGWLSLIEYMQKLADAMNPQDESSDNGKTS